MDSNWNFKSLGTDPLGAMIRPPVSTPLSRQGSIYSWTLGQIQNNLKRDCGSMNMEELLKNVSSAEETTQGMVSTNGEGLRRQGSITLPRILSQKTVDEVWKYLTEEEEHTNNNVGGTNIPQIQRQQTLGETTLEEFLIRAGATGSNNNGGYIHAPSPSILTHQNSSLNVGFEQKPMVSDLLNNIVPRSRNHGSNLHPHVNGSMLAYQPRQQQPIMSKPHGYSYGYGTQTAFPSGQANNNGIRDSFIGIRDQCIQEENKSLVPSIATIPSGAMSVGTYSPNTQFPLADGIRKISVGSSLVSPFPYITSGSNSVRDRKYDHGITAGKKVFEKTQRRKIKNRESAARSRARKHAQTMELEAEVEKLKKENEELLRKQVGMPKWQTNQANEMINLQGNAERKLRRTKSDIN